MIKIKITFKAGYIGDPSSANKTSTVKVTIDYVQNFEENGVQIIYYDSYSIGDVVEFAGSNWYVIEDSGEAQDYVVLLKETVLTGEQLTNNYSGYGNSIMAYYWSEDCHYGGRYSYTDTVTTGCNNFNNYNQSKVKEFLEGTYINTLGSVNLKQVNGYKIRLITLEELTNTFGYVNNSKTATTPDFIYDKNIWQGQSYFTMSPKPNGSMYAVMLVMGNYLDWYNDLEHNFHSVRPVINLYKSAISNN